MKTTPLSLLLLCLFLITGKLPEARAQRPPNLQPPPELVEERKGRYLDSLAAATTLSEKAWFTLRLAGLEGYADIDKAIQLNKEGLALARKSEDPYIIVQAHLMMANKYKRKGRPDDVLSYLKQGMPWLDRSPDKKQNGIYYGQLGEVYMKRGMHEEALKYYRRALETYRQLPDNEFQLATTHNNIASLLRRTGDLEGALENRELASSFWEKTESWRHLEGCWRAVASIYRQLGLEAEAEAALEKSAYFGEKKKKAMAPPSGN